MSADRSSQVFAGTITVTGKTEKFYRSPGEVSSFTQKPKVKATLGVRPVNGSVSERNSPSSRIPLGRYKSSMPMYNRYLSGACRSSC